MLNVLKTGKVKHVPLRKVEGRKKGTHLVELSSLLAYLNAHAEGGNQ